MKKKSGTITGRIVLAMAVLVLGIVLFTVLLNSFFLDNYYERLKCGDLKETYLLIRNASENGRLFTDAFSIEVETVTDRDNIDAILFSSDGTVLSSTANNYEELREQFMTVLLLREEGEDQTIEETDEYVLRRQTDTRLNSDYLVLWGTLPNGSFLMLRSALSSISDTAVFTNRFLIVTGLFAAAIGILIMLLLTRRLTKPIIELSGISRRMTELDFDAKYEGRSYREVDELGENMNLLSERLEHTISELKSANNELLLDNEKKTEIDEMRKEFLSNVSHELKTPLALIRGYAEGLMEGVTDDKESRDFYCEVISDEADKMSTMVGKLLTLNQLEFGGERVAMERFDLTAVINGVLSVNSLPLKQEGITVVFEQNEPLYVWADEFLVEEVLTNYVSNALHHCTGEPKELRIFTAEQGDTVRLSVFNTGTPIPEEELDKIWVKFYKVDKARTREYGGSGIGLSIVKAIMDRMHRACGAVNHADGVEFWIELDAGAKPMARNA